MKGLNGSGNSEVPSSPAEILPTCSISVDIDVVGDEKGYCSMQLGSQWFYHKQNENNFKWKLII